MSPTVHSCLLCGHTIAHSGDPGSSWEDKFRILYSFEERIAVTGVGCAHDPEATFLEASLDSGARWDASEESTVPIGIIRQPPVDGRYGFPFHEACWSLLGQAYGSEPIPQRRLFEVCRSLPFSSRTDCITWDHDYEGLISTDDDRLPWEDLFVAQDLAIVTSDPYFVPELQRLPRQASTSPGISMAVSKSSDIFAKLPLVVLTFVSRHLPTADFLKARLALPSLYPIYFAQQFWASRFLPNADRSWVFESQNWEMSCDWLWLYRCTANGTPGMKNRERVWRLVEKVKAILSLEWTEPVSNPLTDTTRVHWLEATADIHHDTSALYHYIRGGCRRFHERQAQIAPGQLSSVSFSLIQPGNVTYVTGIKFKLRSGEAISLGYVAGEEHTLNITQLTVLELAVGSRGIHAIRCVLDDDQESQWIGCPDNAPKTSRLMLVKPMLGIKAGFDGYKMVSLAAESCVPPRRDALRRSAFWYPRAPERGLCLNESGFTARENAIARYEPICVTMFGGSEGVHLRSLIRVSVTADVGSIGAIYFHYNDEDVPLECRKVGRCDPSDYAQTEHFEIDGPGGEVIDSLTVYIRQYPTDGLWYFKPGFLESFQISTNYGKSCHFAFTQSPESNDDSICKMETVVKGSTIHGLYWTQHENTIFALGAISETG